LKLKIVIAICVIVATILFVIGRRYFTSDPISIGLIADFSSRHHQLGIHSRNSALMAIEKINEEGGIFGRELVLVTKDNENNPEMNGVLINHFLSKGISIIIGPHRSEMAASVLKAAEAKDILVISPIVSSDEFAGLDDNFFRVNTNASSDGILIGSSVLKQKNKRVALIWSRQNITYTGYVISGIKSVLNENSVEIVYEYSYKNSEEFMSIVEELEKSNPDGIIFSSSAVDSSLIIQQYAKKNPLPDLYGCEWNKSTKIHTLGGKTVEGMIIVGPKNMSEDPLLEVDFRESYRQKYSIDTNFSGLYTYEIVLMLREAMLRSGKSLKPENIRKELLLIDDFSSLLGPLGFDSFGDSTRMKSLYIIENNQYVQY